MRLKRIEKSVKNNEPPQRQNPRDVIANLGTVSIKWFTNNVGNSRISGQISSKVGMRNVVAKDGDFRIPT